MEQMLFWLAPVASLMALGFAWYFHRQMMKESEGTPQMKKIAAAVRKGAMSYLRQQYKIVGWVFLGLVILFSVMAYGFEVQNPWVPVAFLTGGFFSGLSGFLGMKTATYASARTANAARNSLNAGLRVAFRSGAVMGLVVVGLGLLDISFWYVLLNAITPDDVLTPTHKLCIITTTMLTFGMGASTQALFARVGGGIYTKAADVGADLVGKVEAGIPEDDPRNPATIADNVGDNVGDVAGMGADLYESYCGSILATAALGAAAFIHSGDVAMQYKAVVAPMLIAAVGILLSIIGIFAPEQVGVGGVEELGGQAQGGVVGGDDDDLPIHHLDGEGLFLPGKGGEQVVGGLAAGVADQDLIGGFGCAACHSGLEGKTGRLRERDGQAIGTAARQIRVFGIDDGVVALPPVHHVEVGVGRFLFAANHRWQTKTNRQNEDKDSFHRSLLFRS